MTWATAAVAAVAAILGAILAILAKRRKPVQTTPQPAPIKTTPDSIEVIDDDVTPVIPPEKPDPASYPDDDPDAVYKLSEWADSDL